MITKETIWKAFRFLSSFDNDDDYVYSPDDSKTFGYYISKYVGLSTQVDIERI